MRKVLVTGGGGFVGNALVLALEKKGVSCHVAGRHSYPHLEQRGVFCHRGDIANPEFAKVVTKDVDTVFHVASLAGIWGSDDLYKRTNIDGTQNILDACLNNGVERLVYTSTPTVVFNRKDIRNGNEELPYAEKFLCSYARTKVEAEKRVLAASQNRLLTTAIRPHLIWGPGDPHLIPRLLERARLRKIRQIGDGENRVDITYIDNVVHAHLLAAQELEGEQKCAGKAYFIGQERPICLWKWIDKLLDAMQVERVHRRVSFPLAYGAGALLEGVHRLFLPEQEPMMTRFLAEQLAKSHYFSHERARVDFSYSPIVSIEEGLQRLILWLKSHETIL